MLRGGHSRLTSSLPSRTDRPPGSAHTTLTQKPSGRMRSPHTGRRRTVGFPPATASAIRRTVSRICAYCATGTLKVPLSARSPWRSTPEQREMLANGAGRPRLHKAASLATLCSLQTLLGLLGGADSLPPALAEALVERTHLGQLRGHNRPWFAYAASACSAAPLSWLGRPPLLALAFTTGVTRKPKPEAWPFPRPAPSLAPIPRRLTTW